MIEMMIKANCVVLDKIMIDMLIRLNRQEDKIPRNIKKKNHEANDRNDNKIPKMMMGITKNTTES